MFFGEKFRRKYALTAQGIRNVKRGTFWTVAVNLVVMGGVGILYYMTKNLIDSLTEGSSLPGVSMYIAAVIAFLVLSLFTHYQQYNNTYNLVYDEIATMRIGLAEKLRKLPLSFFNKRDLSDLTETLMSDMNRLEHVWSHVLGYLHGSYISTGIIAIGLLAYNWKLAISCLWGVPVAFALLFGTRKITRNYSIEAKAQALSMTDGIQETLENVREIRATNQEKRYLDSLNKEIDSFEDVMRRTELVTGIFVNGASVIMRLGVATTILIGAKMIMGGEIEFMTLFMFMLIITRIYAPFDQSLALIAEVFISEISAERMEEIYDTPVSEGTELFNPNGHDIVFDNVSFAYENEAVLNGVSFTAKESEVTALVGPSGSGKSTCARLAARLWDVSGGSIKLGGIDISTVDPETLLTDYSMVFQDVTLFDDTVKENIRLGKRGASDEEVLAAAAAANCDEFVLKLPNGYDTPIGENGARLSGGERQRISIARALLKDAPILLLDEATASLDVESETKVQSALSKLIEGKTVLVIAHRMRTVEAADKIIVLVDGKVAEEGNPRELMSREDSIFAGMRKLQSENAGWRI